MPQFALKWFDWEAERNFIHEVVKRGEENFIIAFEWKHLGVNDIIMNVFDIS